MVEGPEAPRAVEDGSRQRRPANNVAGAIVGVSFRSGASSRNIASGESDRSRRGLDLTNFFLGRCPDELRYWSELWGRKPLFHLGLGTEATRALLFTVVIDPRFMIAVPLLGGITGAIVTVITILIMTDLTSGTGRFNLAQGLLGTLTGISAAVSNSVIGTIVQQFGDVPGLLVMAGGTASAALLAWAFLPETKPAEYGD